MEKVENKEQELASLNTHTRIIVIDKRPTSEPTKPKTFVCTVETFKWYESNHPGRFEFVGVYKGKDSIKNETLKVPPGVSVRPDLHTEGMKKDEALESQDYSQADAIVEIGKLTTADAVNAFIKHDARKNVKAAAEQQVAKLTPPDKAGK